MASTCATSRDRARPADWPAVSPRSAPVWCRGSMSSPTRSSSTCAWPAPRSSSPARASSTVRASRARRWAASWTSPAPRGCRRSSCVATSIATRCRTARWATPTSRSSRWSSGSVATAPWPRPPPASRTSWPIASVGPDRRPLAERHRHRWAIRRPQLDRRRTAYAGPLQRGEQDDGRHRAEIVERPVAVHPHAEVDLRDRVDTAGAAHVDEQAEVDAVALDERHPLEDGTRCRELAGQRLNDVGQLREERGDERAGHQLGYPAATARTAVGRPLVERLHERDVVVVQQRSDQPDDEPGVEVAHVRVTEREQIAGRVGDRVPERLALASALAADDASAGVDCGAAGPSVRG